MAKEPKRPYAQQWRDQRRAPQGLNRPALLRGRGYFLPPGRGEVEYDLTLAELEFLSAINTFKVNTGRACPTPKEILGIIRALGYVKTSRPRSLPPDAD